MHDKSRQKIKKKIQKVLMPFQESSCFFFSLIATRCTTAAVVQCTTQLRCTITFYSDSWQWNANISGTLKAVSLLHFMWGLRALLPVRGNCVNMFLHQCHQVKLLQLLHLKIKVILTLAAECGRLPSSEVHWLSHSPVISDSVPSKRFLLIR